MKKTMLVDTIFDKPLLEKRKHGRKPKDSKTKSKGFLENSLATSTLITTSLMKKTSLKCNAHLIQACILVT
jgi:hypothetical protein